MILFATVLAALSSVGWLNLDDAHHVSGRKLSEGYLAGRTVLVCRDAELAPEMEVTWDSFKTMNFSLIGSLPSRPKEVTYPVYRDAALKVGLPPVGKLYIVNPYGKVVYCGNDYRRVTDILVGQLTKWENPGTPAAFKRAMDFEVAYLPAHAILRYRETAKDFTEAAKQYAIPVSALSRIPGMEELVKLVQFSKKVQDYLPKDKSQREQFVARLDEAIGKYSHLKQSKDPQIVREAKNALADLIWTKVEL